MANDSVFQGEEGERGADIINIKREEGVCVLCLWFCCFGFSHNTCNISLILFIFLFIPFGVSFSLFPSCKN